MYAVKLNCVFVEGKGEGERQIKKYGCGFSSASRRNASIASLCGRCVRFIDVILLESTVELDSWQFIYAASAIKIKRPLCFRRMVEVYQMFANGNRYPLCHFIAYCPSAVFIYLLILLI